MGKVVVLGAAGFLGKQVNELFTKDSFDIVAITRSDCDLTDQSKLLQLLISADPQVIINCAAVVNFDSQPSENMKSINVELVKLLAGFSADNDCHLVHLSSVAIYGSQTELISLDSRYNPDTFYARLKLEADDYIESLSNEYTILRVCGIYGANGPSHLGLNNVITKAKQGFRPSVHGFGTAKRNYIHVKDVAYAILYAVKNKIFNTHLIAGSEVLSIMEIMKTVCDVYLNSQQPKYIEKITEPRDQIIVASPLFPKTHSLKNMLKEGE